MIQLEISLCYALGVGCQPGTRHEEEDGDQGSVDVLLLDGHQLLLEEAQVVHDQVQEDCFHSPII